MAEAWAIDLGTTNTGVAIWDRAQARPRLVELSAICRDIAGPNPLEAPRMVPSATRLVEARDLATRLGARRFFARRFFWGRQAWIGRQALETDTGRPSAAFVPGFKQFLEREPRRAIGRAGDRVFTAREVAAAFLRELLAEVTRQSNKRPREVVMTAPVDAYEAYRAELLQIGRHLGIRRLRFLDEPVAAALGYGLTLQAPRQVLVIDIGGGTMHVALVRLDPSHAQSGGCEVIAKEGRPLGGDRVDRWFLRELCRRLAFPLHEDPADEDRAFWYQALLREACRVKELLFFKDADLFTLIDINSIEARLRGRPTSLEVTRADLVEVLRANGFYRSLEECLSRVTGAARSRADGTGVDEVLMVGGSTLLPDVYGVLEERFGRDKVRAWQPFEAVVYGGAAFAAGALGQSDFIVHDYAFVTHDLKTREPQYTVVVPRGTKFPTAADFWKRQLVPTCSLGEPESIFKLVICEIGGADGVERTFHRDVTGALRKVGGLKGDSSPVIVPLNEANPTLGQLRPPHPPSDRRPRLEIGFGVNAERWLCATVLDLKTRKLLMKEEPVVRLL